MADRYAGRAGVRGSRRLHRTPGKPVESAETKAFRESAEFKTYRESASIEYWAKSQPALANAFGLIQQAMEMALKGCIASISPFLLISRDPKDWPKGVDTDAVPFSEFRTLDAADLVKLPGDS